MTDGDSGLNTNKNIPIHNNYSSFLFYFNSLIFTVLCRLEELPYYSQQLVSCMNCAKGLWRCLPGRHGRNRLQQKSYCTKFNSILKVYCVKSNEINPGLKAQLYIRRSFL